MNTKRNLIQICLLLALSTLNLQPSTAFAQPVTKVAAGGTNSLFLKSDGSLWAMGYNAYGQLGDGTYSNTNRPKQIVASGVTAIAAGEAHSLFLKSDGSLWAMGANVYGQLGDGTYNNTNRPEQIVAGGVTAIAGGSFHSLFLKSDGSLWAMGANVYGQLGDGTYNNTNRPEQIVASNVTAIAAGGVHSLFLKSDGSLWAMGANVYGQLGDGTYSTTAPYGTNRAEQIVASGVTAIAAGGFHSLFLQSDGSLWAMGANVFGQLGDGTYRPPLPMESASPSRLWPAASRRLPPEATTACFSRATAVCGPWGPTFTASWATALTDHRPLWNQPARADCGQQCHGDCRRILPQPVCQERRQSVGHGRQPGWPVGRRHLQSEPTAQADCGRSPGLQSHLPPAFERRRRAVVLCGHGRNQLRAGAFLHREPSQLGAVGDQSR